MLADDLQLNAIITANFGSDPICSIEKMIPDVKVKLSEVGRVAWRRNVKDSPYFKIIHRIVLLLLLPRRVLLPLLARLVLTIEGQSSAGWQAVRFRGFKVGLGELFLKVEERRPVVLYDLRLG